MTDAEQVIDPVLERGLLIRNDYRDAEAAIERHGMTGLIEPRYVAEWIRFFQDRGPMPETCEQVRKRFEDRYSGLNVAPPNRMVWR